MIMNFFKLKIEELSPNDHRQQFMALCAYFIIFTILFPFFSDGTLAQSIDTAKADGVIEALAGVIDNMSETVGKRARQLLFALFVIDIVISFGRASIAGEEMGAVISRFVFRLLFVAFILFIINFGPAIINETINFALEIAADASGSSADTPSVSGILLEGVTRAVKLLGEISILKPGTYFYIFASIITLIITAIQIGMIVTVYAELYIVSLAGLIVLGLAGLESTKDSAILYIKTIIGKALKLMGLLIIFTLMTKIMLEIGAASSSYRGFENIAIILILQIVTVVMIMTIPNSIESLSGGVGGTAASAIVGAVVGAGALKVASAAVAGTAGGVGGGVAGAVSGAKGSEGSLGDKLTAAAKGAAVGGATGAGKYGWAGMTGKVKQTLGQDLMNISKKGEK